MSWSFSYSLDSYVYDDEGEEIEVTYEVEGEYYPPVKGSFHRDAPSDIDYHGEPEWYDWKLLSVKNKTNTKEIKDEWIYESELHELIVHAFEKEHAVYFDDEY